jgi:hypothetical protein
LFDDDGAGVVDDIGEEDLVEGWEVTYYFLSLYLQFTMSRHGFLQSENDSEPYSQGYTT